MKCAKILLFLDNCCCALHSCTPEVVTVFQPPRVNQVRTPNIFGRMNDQNPEVLYNYGVVKINFFENWTIKRTTNDINSLYSNYNMTITKGQVKISCPFNHQDHYIHPLLNTNITIYALYCLLKHKEILFLHQFVCNNSKS